MRARYLTEQALETLRASLEDFLPYFSEETSAPLVKALKEKLKTDEIFRDTVYVFPDEPLLESKESVDELVNIAAVYNAMKDLPAAVAMDERLWAGIAIDLAWSYVRNRWDIAKMFADRNEDVLKKVREHFLYNAGPRRSFTRNAISRLWWLGRLTYDEKAEGDEFHRTRVVCRDLGYVVDLLERNFSNNPRISAEFVDAVDAARSEVAPSGGIILRPELRTLCKYLNMLGGVYILDALPEGMIFRKIHDKAVKIARRKGDPEPQMDDGEEDDDDETAV